MQNVVKLLTVADVDRGTESTVLMVNGSKFVELEQGSIYEDLLINLATVLGATIEYADQVIE